MKRIIINADDFGLTGRINLGIIKAYRDGILTSASLLANGPVFNEAVDLSRQNPGLGVGVHLNILRGRPVSDKKEVPGLVDKNGYFMPGLGMFFLKGLLKKLKAGEIENEFRAQIGKVIAAGIVPTHLDTEKHIHVLPLVSKILFNLAGEFGIQKVRCLETDADFYQLLNMRNLAFCLLAGFTRKWRARLAPDGILAPKRIYGLLEAGRMSKERYAAIFKSISCGAAEIVCHPGYAEDFPCNTIPGMGSFYLNPAREGELEALLDAGLKELAGNLGIQFINYRGLN